MATNVRVLVASEHAPVRRLLRRVVRDEGGVAIAGEARNAAEATALAKRLRPDIALLDFHLPHSTGFDSVRLSRISGLDAAQTISAEMPDTRVVLLTNLDAGISGGRNLAGGGVARLSTRANGGRTPLRLRELCHEAAQPNAPVFADVDVRRRRRLGKRRAVLNAFLGILLSLAGAWMLAGIVLFAMFMIAIVMR